MKLENFPHLVEHLRTKLLQELPTLAAFKQFSPDSDITPVSKDARISAVMLLLYIKKGKWHLLAIRRTKDGGVHSGQIGFPGGRVELEDNNNEETALRETLEEVGIESESIEVLGALSPVMISVSNFRVFPFVGFVEKLLIKNINTVNESDLETGWIYILQSKSTNKAIAEIKDLYKIGFSSFI